MLIGTSLNLKDKRIDKLLQSNGITADTDIYYSPISTGLIIILLMLSVVLSALIQFTLTSYGFLLIPYGLISYLLYAYHNNSFVIHQQKISIINPNFPFRKVTTINLKDIESVTIDARNIPWNRLFLLFGENRLQIKTKHNISVFYCSGLEVDAFDENWTEKTIENLDAKLKSEGVKTVFKLDAE